MRPDFALYIGCAGDRQHQQKVAASVIAPRPEFQFLESGPWSFHNVTTGHWYEVRYIKCADYEIGGGRTESVSDAIGRCLQAIPSDYFRFVPDLDAEALPTLMIGKPVPEALIPGLKIRCTCSVAYSRASESADVQALLYDTSVFESATFRALEGIPPPRKLPKPTLREQYQAAAEALVISQGMILPCQTAGAESQGVCLLSKHIGFSRFDCLLLLDSPASLYPGARLVRRVTYKEPVSDSERTFESDVAVVEEVAP